MAKTLPIVQLGHPILRQPARDVTAAELAEPKMKTLLAAMKATMRKVPGVGLAAPQVGLGLRLAVIEDVPADDDDELTREARATREREAVPFHVLVNPVLTIEDDTPIRHFEGCLSLTGFVAIVARAHAVRVDCLDEHGAPRTIRASGWYARILQHEIDHLNGTVYVDRMEPRTFMSADDLDEHWSGHEVEQVRTALDAPRRPV
ncbi:MAG: peptide deformylase [Candidatus Eisenbacteria bacterium]